MLSASSRIGWQLGRFLPPPPPFDRLIDIFFSSSSPAFHCWVCPGVGGRKRSREQVPLCLPWPVACRQRANPNVPACARARDQPNQQLQLPLVTGRTPQADKKPALHHYTPPNADARPIVFRLAVPGKQGFGQVPSRTHTPCCAGAGRFPCPSPSPKIPQEAGRHRHHPTQLSSPTRLVGNHPSPVGHTYRQQYCHPAGVPSPAAVLVIDSRVVNSGCVWLCKLRKRPISSCLASALQSRMVLGHQLPVKSSICPVVRSAGSLSSAGPQAGENQR